MLMHYRTLSELSDTIGRYRTLSDPHSCTILSELHVSDTIGELYKSGHSYLQVAPNHHTPTSTCTRTQHLAQFLHKHCMNTRRLAVGRRRCPQWCPMLKQRSPRRHFQAFKLAQSDLKYPCFLFPHFFFAESASRSLKVSCRLDMSH